MTPILSICLDNFDELGYGVLYVDDIKYYIEFFEIIVCNELGDFSVMINEGHTIFECEKRPRRCPVCDKVKAETPDIS